MQMLCLILVSLPISLYIIDMALMLPKVDVVFKLLFGDERSKNFLTDFLKAALPENYRRRRSEPYDLRSPAKGPAGRTLPHPGSRQEGLTKGRKAGLAEGRQEERKAVVRSLKAPGDPVEKIARVTGLSVDELSAL
jgi:hypothetical protein